MVQYQSSSWRSYWMLYVGMIMYALYFFGPLTDLYNLTFIKLTYIPIGLMLIFMQGIKEIFVNHTMNNVTTTGHKSISVFFILIVLIFLKSMLFDRNVIDFLYMDVEAALLILSGIFIGIGARNWKHIIKIYSYILLFGIITNLISITFLTSIAREVTENSLINKMQVVLYPSSFFVLLSAFSSSKKNRIIFLIAFIVLCIEQILFQKRFPFFRLLVTLFFIMIVISTYRKQSFIKLLGSSMKYMVIVIGTIIITGIIFTLMGFNLMGAVEGLFARYTVGGSIAKTSIEDGRYQMAFDVLDNLISHDYFFLGQGFGGVISGGMVYWTLQISGTFQKFSTNTIEIGQIWPLWKGGILFWLNITFLFLYGVFRFRKLKHNVLGLACWSFILITWIFLFGESFWHAPLYIFLVGCCIGYLCRRNFDYDPGIS